MALADNDAAARLLELAETASRLPAYDHKNPHAFHEAKSELAAELRKLSRLMVRMPRVTLGANGEVYAIKPRAR